MKMKISEVIVVEGIHDQEKLLKYIDADIILSHGKSMGKDFLDLCKTMNEKRGLIVFTDPDGPGEMIRTQIIQAVGTCKHASLHTLQSKKKGKVGIEHATKEDILEALRNYQSYDVKNHSLDWNDFVDLGLTGHKESQKRRDILSESYYFPISNAKRAFKYLNMLDLDKEACLRALERKGE